MIRLGSQGEFTIRLLQPRQAASIRLKTEPAALGEGLGRAIQETWEALQGAGVEAAGPPFARHYFIQPSSIDVEVGFPVAAPLDAAGRVGPSRLPGGQAPWRSPAGPMGRCG